MVSLVNNTDNISASSNLIFYFPQAFDDGRPVGVIAVVIVPHTGHLDSHDIGVAGGGPPSARRRCE